MAACFRSKLHLLTAGVLLGNVHAQPTQLIDPALPTTITARSIVLNRREDTASYRKIRMTHGNVSVEANEAVATGREFENSQWTFTGAVHIRFANGFINCESAVVTIEAGQVSRARLAGSPALFEQQRVNTQQILRGHAGLIEYDSARSILRLSGRAWVIEGRNQISSETLVYDINKELAVLNPEGYAQGVSITIHPRREGGGTPLPLMPSRRKGNE